MGPRFSKGQSALLLADFVAFVLVTNLFNLKQLALHHQGEVDWNFQSLDKLAEL